MAAAERAECPLVAARDLGHERFVAIIHCREATAIGDSRPL
jgi:hypothetical protein